MSIKDIETFDEYVDAAWLLMCIIRSASNDLKKSVDMLSQKNDQLLQQGDRHIDSVPQIENTQNVTNKKELIESPDTYSSHPFLAVEAGSYDNKVVQLLPITQAKRPILPLQRSLRPLKKWIPSKRLPPKIDEQATINLFAEEACIQMEANLGTDLAPLHILKPVMKLGYERWLDVVIIRDTWKTMNLWQDQVSTLEKALLQSGIFRNVYFWKLDSWLEINKGYVPVFSRDDDNKDASPRQYTALLDSAHPRILLFLSDCISPIWDDWDLSSNSSGIGKIIADLGKQHPVAVVQMLPEHLWMYSGLRKLDFVDLFARTPATPNIHLDARGWTKAKGDTSLPVVMMSAESIFPWSMLISGRANQVVKGVYIPRESRLSRTSEYNFVDNIKRDLDVVEGFLRSVSMETIKLAGYLALTMIDIDLIHYVHEMMMPGRGKDTIAELLFSGILEKMNLGEIASDKEYFRFVNDSSTRNRLIQTVKPHEMLEVMAAIYDRSPIFFNRKDNKLVGFWQFIRAPHLLQDVKPLTNIDKLTIEYFKKAFRQLGPNYAALTEALNNLLPDSVLLNELLDAKVQLSPLNRDFSENQEEAEENRTVMKKDSFPSNEVFSILTRLPQKGFRIERSSSLYTKMTPIHVSMFGETGSGKTWIIQSLGKAFFESSSNKESELGFSLSRIDRFGNSHLDTTFQYPQPEPTQRMSDHLFLFKRYKKGFEFSPSDINYNEHLVCFHDFGGRDIFSFETFVNVSYHYSDVVFVCLDSTKLSSSSEARQHIRNSILTLLTRLDKRSNRGYLMPICLTKSDNSVKHQNLWVVVEEYLGHDVANLIKSQGIMSQRQSEVFWTSSREPNDRMNIPWSPENLVQPFFWVFERFEKKNFTFRFGRLPYPKDS